jgi:hypothetical protein
MVTAIPDFFEQVGDGRLLCGSHPHGMAGLVVLRCPAPIEVADRNRRIDVLGETGLEAATAAIVATVIALVTIKIFRSLIASSICAHLADLPQRKRRTSELLLGN